MRSTPATPLEVDADPMSGHTFAVQLLFRAGDDWLGRSLQNTMLPVTTLITGLIRLLGIYYLVSAMDNAAVPISLYTFQTALVDDELALQLPNAMPLFLGMAAFYVALTLVLFFAAPWLARKLTGERESDAAQVPMAEATIIAMALFIGAWALVRITDEIRILMERASLGTDGEAPFDPATAIHIFLTAGLLGAAVLIVAKFPNLVRWMERRNEAANRALDDDA